MSGTSGSVSTAASADAECETLCDVQVDGSSEGGKNGEKLHDAFASTGAAGSDFVVLSTREL
ncbi:MULTISPECIES: hypothetical protein [Streptomyces]|uniref:Uncharacterized protein n=1 Tax=Streptomyces canarius TaxID=285453 RepID=A0ABQ3CJ16_9ACTN|nr:hypothetical protein [Streptomyces canarius]GHA09118.1 hypothetical protein GCM10010345_11930 [Streptomyces canarius]